MSRPSSSGSRARLQLLERSAFSPFLAANIGLLAIAVLVGGASRENLVQTAIVELAAAAFLPWTIFRLGQNANSRAMITPCLILLAVVIVPLIQLIPVPPALWTRLPHREIVQTVASATGLPPSWRPLSLTPDFTLHSMLSLTAPAAVFLGWCSLETPQRRAGILAVLVLALLSLGLGVMQVTGGGQNLGYLYSNTNVGSLVGFFANRNHEASLLLCSIPLTAGFLASADKRAVNRMMLAIGCLGSTFIVLIALAAVRSRAGVLLAGPAVLASLAVLMKSKRLGSPGRVMVVLGGAVATAAVLVLQFALTPLMSRFDENFTDDLRFTAAGSIWQAAVAHFPAGSGLGSFDVVYRSVEDLNALKPTFLNHAHNDFAEALLETGLAGVLVLAAFLGWAFVQSWKAWTAGSESSSTLARAAVIVIVLLVLHSAVDYPLRTMALSSLFAMACALVVPATGRVAARDR